MASFLRFMLGFYVPVKDPRFKLVFNVPVEKVEACKMAVFAAGAGKNGNYGDCCWTVIGTGQFLPYVGANPNIGSVGQLEKVEEARVETLCIGEDVARKAVEALKE